MVFSRSKENVATRLAVNDKILERKNMTKILGIWIDEDLNWSRNVKEICVKSFSRMSMITKLKYVGVRIEDLLDIYVKYIRSLTEYCSVAFHSSLTVEQSNKIERIQKTSLKVILTEMYVDYPSALETTGLDSLSARHVKNA